ncbi:MAG: hypothetical protein IKY14_00270, partial [Erysipelotrichaceae bacterium]|nr:hypothetical protein [Erysipelotrichaceae bacterium]
MKVKITPSQLTSHYIQVPPSKSYAHRAIICASVAKGISRIDNIDYSKDISATLSAMETFGAKITYGSNYVVIEGVDSFRKEYELHVHCKESGSTLRFLIPLFSLCQNKVTFTGEGRLMQRPQSVYEEVFLSNGTPLVRTEHELIVSESIKSGTYCIQGNVSSQFISGLLFALPLLDHDSKLIIEGTYESKSYVDMTIEMLKQFGIQIIQNERILYIPGSQRYLPSHVTVESDYSQMAFFGALGMLNGPVVCDGMNPDSLQGDRSFVRIIDHHTNVVSKKKDENVLYEKNVSTHVKKISRDILSVKDIIEFADQVNINDVKKILDRQINYNMAIAEEGIKNKYGANIGKVILNSYMNDVKIKAKAYAAAAS